MLDDRSRNQNTKMEIFCFCEELAVVGVGKVNIRNAKAVSD